VGSVAPPGPTTSRCLRSGIPSAACCSRAARSSSWRRPSEPSDDSHTREPRRAGGLSARRRLRGAGSLPDGTALTLLYARAAGPSPGAVV